MPIYTKEKQFELVEKSSYLSLKDIDKKYDDVCLAAIRKDGRAIRFVENQTEELCLEAVRSNG